MTFAAIIGILKAGNELALVVRGMIDQWRQDNPDQPLPAELEDAVLITAFADSITGARATFAETIARLEERAAGERG